MRLFSRSSRVIPIIFNVPDKVYLNNICGICLDKLNAYSALPCGHCFHSKCISTWIEKKMSCPECRTKLTFYLK